MQRWLTKEETSMAERVRPWKPVLPLSRHIFFYGIIGGGKTCKMLTISQFYHSHGYKIWDVFGGRRNEGAFWALPNDDLKLWDDLQSETYEFKEEGPKQYSVNLLYPMFKKELPRKLPGDTTTKNLKSKVFTIPIKSLKEGDVNNVIGSLGLEGQHILDTVMRETTRNSFGPDIDHVMDMKLQGMQNSSLYRLFFRPLIDARLLSSSNFDLNLNWVEEAKDKNKISVICLDYVPDRFKHFVMGWVVRQIVKLLRTDKVHKKHIALFREASEFMKIQDSATKKGDPVQHFRGQISDLARYGRDGFHLCMDTQSPNEVKGMIEGQDDLLCICEMPSPTDREQLCKPLMQDGRMAKFQYSAIATLKVQEICVVERGERSKILKRIQPPRSRYWKEGKGNFETTWRNEVDKWSDIGEYKDLIEKSYKERMAKNAVEKDEILQKMNETKSENIVKRPDKTAKQEEPKPVAPSPQQLAREEMLKKMMRIPT